MQTRLNTAGKPAKSAAAQTDSIAYCAYCHSPNIFVASTVVAYWPVTAWERDANGRWSARSDGHMDISWRGGAEHSGRHPFQSQFRCRDCDRVSGPTCLLHGEDEKRVAKEMNAWAAVHLPECYRIRPIFEERHACCQMFNDGPTYRVAVMQRHTPVPRYIENRLVLSSTAVPGSAAVEVKWVVPTKAAPTDRTAFIVPVGDAFAVGRTALLAEAKAALMTKALLRKQAKTTPAALPTRVRARI